MIHYKCSNCSKEFDIDFDSVTCKYCHSENITPSEDSFKTYTCNKCENVLEIPFEESKGYYNWKCGECYSMMQCTTFNIVGETKGPKKQVLNKGKVTRPNIDYLTKEYGDELNKPIESFKKKKK